MPLFCHKMDVGFTGEDVGIAERICDEFFPMPTDRGICLTKNMDIRTITNVEKHYDELFESKLQNSAKKIESGTKWGEISFVFLTAMDRENNAINKRKPNTKSMNVHLQLHQDNEFAQIFSKNDFDEKTIALNLEYNHEYFIKVTPSGKISTEGLRTMSNKNRPCLHENEIPEDSLFKTYTENNCRYECYVKLAKNQCQCIPWDFLTKDKLQECDVFGRTCFFKAMENFTQYPKDPCPNCVLGCEYIKYKKEIVEKKILSDRYEESNELATKNIEGGETFRCYPYKGKIFCKGEEGFLDFFHDVNRTFIDKGYENAYNSLLRGKFGGYEFQRAKMYEYAIIVHLKFMEPEINEVGVKYMLMDKLAMFGGNLGIFETITGWSLVGIINLSFLTFKYIFSST